MSRLGKFVAVSYDDIFITPQDSGECSICLTMPQVDVLLGLLEPLVWVTRWVSDSGEEIDQDLVEAFVDDVRRRLMAGCNDVQITRFDDDGDFQISSDGGETFVDDLGADPRNGYFHLPSLSGDDGSAKRCAGANSVITYLKNAVASIQTAKNNEASASDIGAVFVGILILLGIITVGWAFAFLGALIALIYANVSAEEWAAAFTSDAWQQLLCIIFAHEEDDASFTVDGVKAIISDLEADMDEGVAQSFFLEMFRSLWAGGLTTSARQNLGGSLDCTCGECPTANWIQGLWDGSSFINVQTIVEVGDCYFICDSVDRGDGRQGVYLVGDSDTIHCVDATWSYVSGYSGPFDYVQIDCGTSRSYANFVAGLNPLANKDAIGIVGDTSNVPFRVRIDMAFS